MAGLLAAILVLCAPLASSRTAAGEIYRWTDAEGRVHYTQDLSKVPAAHRGRAEQGAARRSQEPSRVQTYSSPASRGRRSASRTRGGPMSIPFQKRGNAMVVMVRLNDRVSAPFLVDTGASDVSIPAAVARQAGIVVGPRTPRARYRTANGIVSHPVVTVDSVQVGEVRVEGVRGSISSSMDMGLLGGSFFNNFTFQVDPAAHVITLVPNNRVRSGLSERQWRQRFREMRSRLSQLEHYLESNHFTRESRVEQLEEKLAGLHGELRDLERQADLAEVPHAWRE